MALATPINRNAPEPHSDSGRGGKDYRVPPRCQLPRKKRTPINYTQRKSSCQQLGPLADSVHHAFLHDAYANGFRPRQSKSNSMPKSRTLRSRYGARSVQPYMRRQIHCELSLTQKEVSDVACAPLCSSTDCVDQSVSSIAM